VGLARTAAILGLVCRALRIAIDRAGPEREMTDAIRATAVEEETVATTVEAIATGSATGTRARENDRLVVDATPTRTRIDASTGADTRRHVRPSTPRFAYDSFT